MRTQGIARSLLDKCRWTQLALVCLALRSAAVASLAAARERSSGVGARCLLRVAAAAPAVGCITLVDILADEGSGLPLASAKALDRLEFHARWRIVSFDAGQNARAPLDEPRACGRDTSGFAR